MSARVQVTKIEKSGEGYLVQGKVEGQTVGFHAHAESIDGKSRPEVEAYAQRTLQRLAEDRDRQPD